MKIRQALISLSDKRGALEFARGLAAQGVKLLSTGGTAKLLRDAGLAVTEIGDYTGFPEMLDGRVKTLHPKVHGGILARRDLPEHLATIEQHGIPMIDLVCVNLYPFAATIAKPNVTLEDAIENIDIGGPAMVRSSAKNYTGVAVVTDPEDYVALLEEMNANDGALTLATRFSLAKKAFTHTARYDAAIANWLTSLDEANTPQQFPAKLQLAFDRVETLRYGENPTATRFRRPAPSPPTRSCRARNSRTTTSATPMPRGNASRLSPRRPASSSSTPIRAAWPLMSACCRPMKKPSRPIRPRPSAASSPSTAPSILTSLPP